MSGNNRLFIIYSSIFVIQATAFWFALPPVKMEKGLRITVTDMNDWEFVTETTNPVAITRNEV